ncbi:MATE family efflux transporter [Clostridium acetireducens]|nr:MATE family efflux transporter [Clostridium acetireducens]
MGYATVNNKKMKRKFIRYLLPSVSAMWVYSLYTMVDGIFVSWGVGTTGIASVNIAMPFINFIFAISVFFATGASTLTSIALGKNDSKRANEIFTINFIAMVLISIIIVILTLLNLNSIATFLGANELTINYVKDYLRIITIFNGFFITSYCLEVFTKTDGFPYLAIVGVVSSALTNIILDYLFVIKFNWGIKGAAYATGISQVIATLIYIVHFNKKKSRLKFIKCKFDFSLIKDILSIGLPDSLTEFSTGAVIYIFNQIILSNIGNKGIVTYSIISYINLLVLMTMIGITQGMQPLCSFYYGKEDEKAVNSLFNMAAKTITITSVLIFIIVNVFSSDIIGVFMHKVTDRELISYSIKAIRIFSLSFIIVGYNILISGFFAAIAKPKHATIISISRGFIIITLTLFIMTNIFGEIGIWLSTAVSEGISVFISLILFKNNSYVKEKFYELSKES